MKYILGKIFGLIAVILVIIPLLSLSAFFIVCKNYIWSGIISMFTLYLILGFTGIACFLAISMSIILTEIGQIFWKKSNAMMKDSMDKKLSELSDVDKNKRNRTINIDNIIGRFGNIS